MVRLPFMPDPIASPLSTGGAVDDKSLKTLGWGGKWSAGSSTECWIECWVDERQRGHAGTVIRGQGRTCCLLSRATRAGRGLA